MKRSRLGFTLMELLIVIAIIITLVSVIVPTVSNYTTRAKETVCAANRRSLLSLVVTSVLIEDYPTAGEAFEAIYDSKTHVCPLGGEFSWSDENGGEIVCNHLEGGSGGSGGSGGGSDESESSTAPVTPTGVVTLYDTDGTPYFIPQTDGIEEKIQSGAAPERGSVYCDATGACVFLTWSGANDIKDMTIDEITEKYPNVATRIDTKTLVTQNELDSTPTRPAGTLCQYGGKYYYSTGPSNQWNKPPGGMWVELL